MRRAAVTPDAIDEIISLSANCTGNCRDVLEDFEQFMRGAREAVSYNSSSGCRGRGEDFSCSEGARRFSG
jgi:hypothetical protein